MPKTVHSDAGASVLRVLIEARKTAGVTQAELARRVGSQQPVISLIERGVRRVDVVEFYVLARAIGADPVDLFRKAGSGIPLSQSL
ncbi:helix-turn-helix transcriptional regulator [Brevundimonas sp. A19_0]|uniref:helix-turn-helix domain-containing protein n=1 Tax=Brevundimonas sp. A19_0 TaxID=2821087 RepID=UPI001ADA0CEB|nr:helix-turn-helix transcriptional regulator [Brevundimonas sp. A19_0]MBO9501198.1 helix-turn-helix transcriptional regulator [Brevundimonas sp. A19_0]